MSEKSLLDQAVTAAAELQLDRVPEATVLHAGKVIADTVGVARAGGREPEVQRLIAFERAQGASRGASSEGSATVLVDPALRVRPDLAAFLNATGGSFLELDEGMRPTGHPGMQVVVPALAAAEATAASGDRLLAAVLAGYEVAARLFTGFRLRPPAHPHGHFGGIGGAVAVAIVRGADPVEAARIASTSPILTTWEACYEGATARNTWMGSAARSAVRASDLADAGFTGSGRAFETGFGVLASELVDEAALVAPLDHARLGIGQNYFKLHSACALTHAAVDAVLRLPGFDAAQIEGVSVETVSNNMKLDRQAVPNALSARFSLPYVVAAAMMIGEIEPDTFAYRDDIAKLAARVEVRVAEDLEARWPGSSPARVTVTTADGELSATAENPYGHHRNPIGDADLRAKFDRLVGAPGPADDWWKRLTALRHVSDCSQLFSSGG